MSKLLLINRYLLGQKLTKIIHEIISVNFLQAYIKVCVILMIFFPLENSGEST